MTFRTRRYAPVPKRAGKFTELQIFVPPVTFAFRIEGPLSARNRRVLALAIFRAVKPTLRFIESGMIHHFGEGHILNLWKDANRDISLRQALEAETPNGKIGFAIRMWRLNLGLTQKQLARRIGMNSCHLSRIEHGKSLPKKLTLQKIERQTRTYRPPKRRNRRLSDAPRAQTDRNFAEGSRTEAPYPGR